MWMLRIDDLLYNQCFELAIIDVSVGYDAYIQLASMHVHLARITY